MDDEVISRGATGSRGRLAGGRGFRVVVCGLAVVAVVGGAPPVASAQQPVEPAPGAERPAVDAAPPALVVALARECADEAASTTLLGALGARLPGWRITRGTAESEGPAGAGPAAHVVSWRPEGDGRCAVVLHTGRRTELLDLPAMATEAEVRAAAVRLAWWLEAAEREPPAEAATEPPAEAAAEPGVGTAAEPAVTAAVGPEASAGAPAVEATETVDVATEAPGLSIGAQLGPAWTATPGTSAVVVRVLVAIGLSEHLQLGLEGRLATEASARSTVADVDVFERSVGIFGRYRDRLGARWPIDVTLGVRYALPNIDVEEGLEAEIDSAFSNLMLVTGMGAGFALTPALLVKLDVVGAVAVANREVVTAGGEPLADLGVLGVEALLGFELSF